MGLRVVVMLTAVLVTACCLTQMAVAQPARTPGPTDAWNPPSPESIGCEVWTNRLPQPRSSTAMVYDTARRRAVMFGGYEGAHQDPEMGDTWEWDGAQRAQIITSGPSARYAHAMAYDEARGQTVLFGGYASSHRLDDTWLWDGAAWTQVGGPAPTARQQHAMAYDAARGRTVLFGG